MNKLKVKTNKSVCYNNSNKILISKIADDINLSEGADGLDVENTLTTPSEGALQRMLSIVIVMQ